jgi:hypothetical protein
MLVENNENNNEAGANENNAGSENNNNQNENKQQNVDVESIKNNALAEFLKTLGVEDTEKLKDIVTKQKETEEANKTELQKSNDTLTETTKQLVAEREARMIADAKLEAIKQGARAELVEDLVIVAKSKVTKDKDIKAVIAEIKDSETGKVYFETKEEKEQKEQQKKKEKNVTRKRVKSEDNDDNDNENNETFASRFFANKNKKKESYYFK